MTQIVIAGVSGAIGSALARQLLEREPGATILGLCRDPESARDRLPEKRVKLIRWDAERSSHEEVGHSLNEVLGRDGELDMVIYAAGLLHDDELFPEKRIEDLDAGAMTRSFAVNCTGLGTLIRAAVPHLRHRRLKKVVAVSAKVGSIGDNRFGGWYAYRSSKAALNMLVKNLSVELPRRCRPVSCIAVHPGTTTSALSAPFQQSLAQLKLHSPEDTARNLMTVIEGVDERSNGSFLNWDGEALPW